MRRIIKALRRRRVMHLVNKTYAGANPKHFEKKRKLLNKIGYEIGEGTKIVGPIECTGKLIVGKNCWIGKNFKVNGNGTVIIGDNCDIAPEVTFATGTHEIGNEQRRAGEGKNNTQRGGNGTWNGTRVTIVNETEIGSGCVVAACACVTKNVADNTLVGGIPAKVIREL